MTQTPKQILIFKMEDGSTRGFDTRDSIALMLHDLQKNEVETIIAGEIDSSGAVLWEKQFNACTVMPAEFGKANR